MIRFFFVRLVFPLLLVLFVRALIRSIFTGIRSAQSAQSARRSPEQPQPVSSGGELKRDPVCGTYVSTATSLSRKVDGGMVYFCSKECRDNYRAA